MKRSVITILNYNDWQTCKRLIEKIKNYQIFEKIILVDNCSTDDSFIQMKQYQTEENINMEVLQSPTNGGYAKGNNFGIRYAIQKYQPEVLFVANPDVLFEETAAKSMVRVFQNDPAVGIVAPMVEHGYNVWNQPGFWGIIEALFLIWFNLDKRRIRKRLLKKRGAVEVGVVEGSFFAISKEAFCKVDGFDERTFLYCEENILGKRLKEKQYKTMVLTDVFYEHLHSQSIRKAYRSKAKAFRNFYDSFVLYLKEYLKINAVQKVIFEIAYKLGYVERVFYDFLYRKRLS